MIIDLNKFLIKLSPNAPIEEMFSYCKTIADFESIFTAYCALHKNDKATVVPISEELKQAALKITHNVKFVDVAYIQRKLKIPYPLASSIYDWLKS